MEEVDNIETTNARAWEEETQGSRSPKATRNLASRTAHQGSNASHVPSRRVPPAVVEVSRNLKNHGVEQKAGRSNLISSEHLRHYRRRDRHVKDQTMKMVNWSKQNAVTTKRKQDHLDKKAEKAAKGLEYLRTPADDNLPSEGYYLLSDIDTDPNSFLGENLELLDNVRMNCEVYIDFVEALGCIRLCSTSTHNIENAISSIKTKIQHARANAASHAVIYIVEPPAEDNMKYKLIPVFEKSQPAGKQPTIIGVTLSRSLIDTTLPVTWEVERQATIQSNKERFSKHIMTALAELGSLKNTKQMRSYLGNIHLLRYRRDFEKGYSFQKFKKMMEEFSTQGKFQKIIRGASAARSILDRFTTATELFEQVESWACDNADVKEKHSLEIIAHGPSTESIRIEAEIDMVQRSVSGRAQSGAAWQIGAIKYYHHGQNAHKTHLAVGMLSVESPFDSCLEISTKEAMSQPPKIFQKLVEGCVSGTSIFESENMRVTYPTIKLVAQSGVVIDNVLVKSALQYELRGTSYIAEVTVHHGWNSANTRKDPEVSCDVSLYHKDWDLLMTPDESLTEPAALSIESLFPTESLCGDGISSFLDHAQKIQQLASPTVAGAKAPPLGDDWLW